MVIEVKGLIINSDCFTAILKNNAFRLKVQKIRVINNFGSLDCISFGQIICLQAFSYATFGQNGLNWIRQSS